jgi:hypothetical protein
MRRILSIVLLMTGLDASARSGSLRKVWELDLGAQIKGPLASEGIQPGILAVRFSPDGKRIAVAGNPYRFGQPAMSRLIVVQVSSPRENIQRFGIEFASDSEFFGPGGPPAVAWSPAEDFILAGRSIVGLRDGASCGIPNSSGWGFLGPNRIVAGVLLGIDHGVARSRIEFFDSECKSGGEWDPEYPDWGITDVSPERGFVSMGHRNGLRPDAPREIEILDPIARKVIQSWPAAQSGYESRFADNGHVLCVGDGGADLYENRKVPPRCMDVDTGEKIAEARGIVGGAPFAAAEHGSRVVASDHSSTFNLRFREYDTALKRRVVWDFRKNTEIASWKPEMQTYSLLGGKPAKEPFVFAISPDGEYVAEGGNGILRLYKIDP